jgi:acyl-CoA thioester hydrolase
MPQPFETFRRVEFGDTDMAGIVHFANFFRYMEVAETDFLTSQGLSVSFQLNGQRVGFPRVSASCDYSRPARFGDTLRILVHVEKVGRRSVSYRHEFYRGEEHLATGKMTAVFCRKGENQDIESVDIPPEIRAKLESGLTAQ